MPTHDALVAPEHPTSSDVVAITLSGDWPDTCIPDDSNISVVGNDIYFDVIRDYPSGCFTMITPWALTESIGPLSAGAYTVYAGLVEYPDIPDFPVVYEPVAEFIVTDKQFVLSAESLTVPDGGTEIFTVALLLEPAGTVEVSVTHQSGDTDITVQSGGTLFFDPCNYSVPQSVTLAAAEDDDYLNGVALIQVSAPEYLTAEVTATEGDNDIPPVLYVDADATGNNNGSSWVDAFIDLQDALGIAEEYPEVEKIHVAQGIYRPAGPSGNRNATFQLVNGLIMKGGYAGFGEPDPNARNVGSYKTILSGDLNGDDGPNFTNRGDNSYLVVKGRNGAVLDGFTITGGDGGGVQGGGIHSGSSDTTIINCTVINNRAGYGGGLYSYNGSPTLINCIISGNLATAGGGIYCEDSYNATITNCVITENAATSGGGICCHVGMMGISYNDVIMTNCTFYANTATYGGAVRIAEGSNPSMANCILWGDNALNGPEIAMSTADWGSALSIIYSDAQGGQDAIYDIADLYWGPGNIDTNPFFADPCNGDYHLKSAAGRWDPNSESWVTDGVTSPCIDRGNPGCPLGDEPNDANNIRINMGAYGGTAEASKLPDGGLEYIIADLTNSWVISKHDLEVFVSYWLESGECIPSDLNRSKSVDFVDYAIFAQYWLYPPPPGGAGIEYEISPCDMFLSASEPEQTRFTITVEGRYIHFEDTMTANCCPEQLWLEMDVTGNLITIHENEELGEYICLCNCYYPITATLGPFEPGNYTLDVYENWGGFIGSTTVNIE